jgi:AI-2 transport protein TqsA
MSEAAPLSGSALRTLQGLAAGVLVVAGLKLGAPVLVPVTFAGFLALLALPLLRALAGRRVPVGLAVAATLAALVVVLALFVVLLLGSLGELQRAAPSYMRALEERVVYTVEWWQEHGVALRDWIPPSWRNPDRLAELATKAIRGTVELLAETTVVLLLLVFLLAEAAVFPRKLARLPAPVRDALLRFADASREVQRYLWIKTLMAAAIALVAGAWLAFLGVDFAVLCALVTFALHYVPNIGAVLAAVPPMAIAFAQFDLATSLSVMAGYVVIGMVLGNLVEPALLGRQLRMSAFVVFLSLVVWGWLWGPIGMLLSVPLTMACKIGLAASTDGRWLAELLDSAPPLPPAAASGSEE